MISTSTVQTSPFHNVLQNNALEARRRRGRAEQPNSLDMRILSESRLSRPSPLGLGDPIDLGLEGENALFANYNASELTRKQHVRRKRQFYGPRMQAYSPRNSTNSPLLVSAPAALIPHIQPPSVAPLRITPKISTNRYAHARSYSAPSLTPIASPDSILSFYIVSPTDGDSETDSDDESVYSAPPSTTEQLSMNMFLAQGDSIDSWPTEFPVEALEEKDEHEHELIIAGDANDIEGSALKRRSTEATVKLLRARRRRAGVPSMISQKSITA